MNMFSIGASAIIVDEQRRVLLCHRTDRNFWNLPGGGVEQDETPWQAVVREVKEEVGLDVVVSKLLGVYKDPTRNDLVFSFACTIIGGALTLTNEADAIDYFAFEQIPANTFENHIFRIKDFLHEPDMMHLKMLPEDSWWRVDTDQ